MENRLQDASRGGFGSPLALVAGVGVVALLVRLLYIQCFSNPMPFWDQWDGEWANALRPFLDGSLQWNTLLTPHNEHRILPTRLLTLALYKVTGEWNNMYEARVSALVYCIIPAVLAWHALTGAATRASRAWMLAAIGLLSVLPFSWENFLVGFQSQFYVLALSSIVAISLAARHHQSVVALLAAVALSVLACVTMASGIVTAMAIGATCALACLCLPGRRAPALVAVALLATVAVAAYSMLPVVEAHAVLRAQSLGELLLAATHTLAWPARDNNVVVLVWLPSVVMVVRMLIRRKATPTDVFMAGLCIWSGLQGMAIAYGRGHEGMRTPASRYTELFVPGVVGNVWFALQLWGLVPTPSRRRTAARTAVVLFGLLIAGALLGQVAKDLRKIRTFAAAREVQQQNVHRYLDSGDPAVLMEAGEFELPYPDAARLKGWLDDPMIRTVLPPRDGQPAQAPSP